MAQNGEALSFGIITDSVKLHSAMHRWTPEELTVVADVLEDNHLACAKTIWLRLVRREPHSDKRPRDIETLLERIARYARPAVIGAPDTAEKPAAAAAADADDLPNRSLDAFLCMLDDLVPGGLDFSSQLADVLVSGAGEANGQLAEAYLFLASLLDGRPFNPERLSVRTCRRLVSMLSDLLNNAKAATEQTECLVDLMGLAYSAASMPKATVIRDRMQAKLRMPLSAAAPAAAAVDDQPAASQADAWLRSRFSILADYAAYSMNPLNLPDRLLQLPGDKSAAGQAEFSLPGEPNESFMQRYIKNRANLVSRVRIAELNEPDEDFLIRVRANVAPKTTRTPTKAAPKRPASNLGNPSSSQHRSLSASSSAAKRQQSQKGQTKKPLAKGAKTQRLKNDQPKQRRQKPNLITNEI